jgi:hypothetical protein
MTQYLLSVHSVEGEVREPMSAESFRQVGILERAMKSAGAWVFSGRLHEPDSATVVRVSDGEVLTTDGPFAESKEHLGAFRSIVRSTTDRVGRQDTDEADQLLLGHVHSVGR